jgi:hypothetical protein
VPSGVLHGVLLCDTLVLPCFASSFEVKLMSVEVFSIDWFSYLKIEMDQRWQVLRPVGTAWDQVPGLHGGDRPVVFSPVGTAKDQVPGLHGGDRPIFVCHKFSSLYYYSILGEWRNIDAMQKYPMQTLHPMCTQMQRTSLGPWY